MLEDELPEGAGAVLLDNSELFGTLGQRANVVRFRTGGMIVTALFSTSSI